MYSSFILVFYCYTIEGPLRAFFISYYIDKFMNHACRYQTQFGLVPITITAGLDLDFCNVKVMVGMSPWSAGVGLIPAQILFTGTFFS